MKEDLVKKQEAIEQKIEEGSESDSSSDEFSSKSAATPANKKQVQAEKPADDVDWNNYIDPFKAKYDEKVIECKELTKSQKQTTNAIKDLMLSFEKKLKDS